MRPALLLAVCVTIGCGGARPASAPASGTQPRVLPSSWLRDPTPDAAFRKDPPAPGPEVPFVSPKIEEITSGNGIRVLWVTRRELPIVSLRIVSSVGADQGEPGLTSFVAWAAVDKTMRRALEHIGVTRDVAVGYDGCSFTFRSFIHQVEPVLGIVADALRKPTHRATEVESVRSKRELASSSNQEDVDALASEVAHELVFPEGHAYRFPIGGTVESLKHISIDALKAHHALVFDPRRVAIVAAGDIDEKVLRQALAKSGLDQWKGAGVSTKPVAKVTLAGSPRILLVDHAGESQAEMRVVGIGPPVSAEGRVARSVLSKILSRRLYENLREKHGWTYGAGGGFRHYRAAGLVSVGGAIEVAHAGEALREMLAELRRLGSQAVTDDELADGKKKASASYANSFDTVSATTNTLMLMALFGHPTNEYENLRARIDAVTADQLLGIAKQYLRPEEMSIVVVGDAAKLRPQLEALSLGKVEVRAASSTKTADGP